MPLSETTNGHLGPEQHTMNGNQDQEKMEATMKEIVANTLGRAEAKVKMHRSFLAQGGDSLLAIKLMSQCREQGYDVSIRDILQSKSVRELCLCLSRNGEAGSDAGDHTTVNGNGAPPQQLALSDHISGQLGRITPNPSHDVEAVFACSPIQEIFLTAHGIHAGMYQCTAVIEVSSARAGGLDYSRLAEAWRAVSQRHRSLRTVFVESDERPGHFEQAVLKEEIVSLTDLGEAGEGVASDIASRQVVPFEPLAPHKVTLLRRASGSAQIRLDISHALVDGESLPILLQDLSTTYSNNNLKTTTMSYADYVSHQQQLNPQTSIAYWSTYLSGAQPTFFPPTNDQASREGLRTARSQVDFPAGVLEEFCGKFDVTAANICQVAWALVLRSYTGSNDVCFSYVSSGRQAPLKGIERTIGAFVDTMICRVSTSGEKSLADALGKAKRDVMDGLSHPCVFAMNHEGEGGSLSRLRGNTIMSCLRKLPGGGEDGLAFEILDAVNPSEVSFATPSLDDLGSNGV